MVGHSGAGAAGEGLGRGLVNIGKPERVIRVEPARLPLPTPIPKEEPAERPIERPVEAPKVPVLV